MGINLPVDERDRVLQQPELSKKRNLTSCTAIKYSEPVVKNLPLKKLQSWMIYLMYLMKQLREK